ncbi:low temperature requirement protein LtrA [Paenarthrobacter nicotinovorans]|uniref:low temperature requirement protein A n=1 Tax=Paenarthrobacter nicotinovorans TaxID=29320 RepID=UPI00278AA96C|nr:low temperature requirement protein A [Paenarthrobacter nicotinovorans]MDP9933952.1 low temperature requirement protein LtrA [Paenarthrobacter nicotinovorans]
MVRATSLMRSETSEDQVTRVELFFDLVFVFALSQLSHHLLDHLSWLGAGETFVLLLAVYKVWVYTTWSATLLDTSRREVQWMLLIVMLVTLFMNASIDSSFGAFGVLFVVCYLAVQLGRGAWMLTAGLERTTHDHFVRTLVWGCMSAPFWITGVFFDAAPRLLIWGVAAAIDLGGHMLAHRLPGRKTEGSQVPLPGERIFERFGLFYLIALGETILSTGLAIAANLADPLIFVTGTVGLAGSVAIWWCYFHGLERDILDKLATVDDQFRPGILAGNTLVMLLAGLILVAAGDQVVITDPATHPDLGTVLLLFGGPALFLAGRGIFIRKALGLRQPTDLIGIGALVAVAALSPFLPAYIAALGAALPLVGVAVFDTVNRRRTQQQTN